MRHEIEVSEFSAVIQEFAAYKSAIQGCSQRTVEEYLLDLRTFFRYLLCREDAEVLNDPERFATVSVLPVDLEYLRTVTADQIYAFLIYADSVRENRSSAKARKLSSIKALFKYLVNKRGYLAVNPAANIDSPKKKKALPKYLTLEESVTLLETVAADRDSPHRVRDYAILTLFLNCGMRHLPQRCLRRRPDCPPCRAAGSGKRKGDGQGAVPQQPGHALQRQGGTAYGVQVPRRRRTGSAAAVGA